MLKTAYLGVTLRHTSRFQKATPPGKSNMAQLYPLNYNQQLTANIPMQQRFRNFVKDYFTGVFYWSICKASEGVKKLPPGLFVGFIRPVLGIDTCPASDGNQTPTRWFTYAGAANRIFSHLRIRIHHLLSEPITKEFVVLYWRRS